MAYSLQRSRFNSKLSVANTCTVCRCLLLLGTVGLLTGTSIGVWSLGNLTTLLACSRQVNKPVLSVFFRVNRSTFVVEVQAEGQANWLLLCHENWDSSLGMRICRQLGHVRLTHHKGVNLTDVTVSRRQEYALLPPSWKGDAAGKWQVRSSCPSGRIVALKCSECGTAYSKAAETTGGKETRLRRWPWQVTLYLNAQPVCAGTLVSHKWIVTAAHCVDCQLQLSGWVALVEPKDDEGQGRVAVEKVVAHPNYDREHHDYDIAMLKLKEPLAFSETVQAVCLPLSHQDLPNSSTCWISGQDYQRPENVLLFVLIHNRVFYFAEIHIFKLKLSMRGEKCWVLGRSEKPHSSCLFFENDHIRDDSRHLHCFGWPPRLLFGKTLLLSHTASRLKDACFPLACFPATSSSAETPTAVSVSLITSKNCNTSCMHAGKITPRMLCAHYVDRNTSTCKAERGVPLVCQQADVPRLVGIGSREKGLKSPRLPGVYTKVVEFLDWIHHIMEEKG
ncbi:transmembrane protease serine 5 [Pogona vitticeps]